MQLLCRLSNHTAVKVQNLDPSPVWFVRHYSTLYVLSEYFAPFKGIWIPESGKFLLAESATMGFRIKNIAGSNLNLDAMESKIHVLSNKYFKTVLDSLTLGKVVKQTRLPLSQHFCVLVFDRIFIYIYRICFYLR